MYLIRPNYDEHKYEATAYYNNYVCLSVRVHNRKNISQIYSIFCTTRIMPVTQSSSKIIRIGILIWTQEFIAYFNIPRSDKICHQRMP